MRETIVDRAYAKTLLPPRKEDGHKGDFGKLLVLGGSVGYTGAPYLAASAAVHSGCGLVYLGVPESIWAVEAQKCVSAMPFPLPETDGRLCLAALDRMQDKLKGCDVLALGPGLGRGKETEQLIHTLLWQVKEPLVLDADGLNALQGCTEKLDVRRIRRFAESDAFARICAADAVLRELAFITALPASAVLAAQGSAAPEGEAAKASVLVQGIADIVLVFPDHLELLDYKTDRRKTEADFLAAYRAQLNLYALAIDKRFAPKKVTYKGIYSLELGKLIEV